jgi:Plasmid pRiA4b ORF-3-like protein
MGQNTRGLRLAEPALLAVLRREAAEPCATCSSHARQSSTISTTSATAGSIASPLTNVRAGQPGISYPRYVGGERNGPPEDCGGIPSFYELLEALADPKHPNHADAKQWSDDYDPGTIDELPIKYALGRIANRRNAARSRVAKKKPLGSAA